MNIQSARKFSFSSCLGLRCMWFACFSCTCRRLVWVTLVSCHSAKACMLGCKLVLSVDICVEVWWRALTKGRGCIEKKNWDTVALLWTFSLFAIVCRFTLLSDGCIKIVLITYKFPLGVYKKISDMFAYKKGHTVSCCITHLRFSSVALVWHV